MGALPYVGLYLLPALVCGLVAVKAWRRRAYEGAEAVGVLMAAVAFWCICHAMSVVGPTLENTLFWAQVQYGGIVLVPLSFLQFALSYSSRWSRLPRALQAVLYTMPALSYLAVLTNSQHYLWWTSVELDTSKPFASLAVTRGPLFWAWFSYTYACILVGLGLFVQTMLESSPIYRRQARLVVVGALFPILGNIAYISGLRLDVVDDPTPFLFAVSGACFLYAVRRYHLLDLGPIAQREIYESMPDGLVVLDRRGVVVAINEPARRLLQLAPEAWTGRSLRSVADDSPLGAALRELASEARNPTTCSVSYEQPDGPHAVEIRRRPLQLDVGRPAGLMFVLRDTTELERAQRALRQRLAETTLLNRVARTASASVQTEGLLRTIALAMLDATPWDRVIVALLDGAESSLRLTVDQTRGSATSYEGIDLFGADVAEVLALARSGRPMVVRTEELLETSPSVGAGMRTAGLYGGAIVPLSHQERRIGVLFVGSEGERQVTDDDLRMFETIGGLISEAVIRARLYDEAEQSNRLKATFLATVSHELRTPLSSIIGYTEMLDRGFFGELPERARDAVQHVDSSGRALLQLITDILDFSTMEAGHFDVPLHPTDVAMVVHAVAAAHQPQAHQRGVELRVEMPPDLPLIRANSSRLQQVLSNLVSNALKFTEAGTITVAAAVEGEHVLLRVSDTGIGIPPGQHGEIFQAFRRIDSPQSRRFGGSGLGLAITRRLVELMGGAIQVESALGVGSTFTCALPLAQHVNALEQAAS